VLVILYTVSSLENGFAHRPQVLAGALLVAMGLALGCPGGEGAPGTLIVEPSLPPLCGTTEDYGPNTGRSIRTSCIFQGEFDGSNPSWKPGEPTPAGPYQCHCASVSGAQNVFDAVNCEDALLRGCGIDPAQPPVMGCSERYYDDHYCWPVRDNPSLWSCRCAPWDELVQVPANSCREAAAEHCRSCTSPRGRCTRAPAQSNGPEEFDCTCADGSALHIGSEAEGDCSLALVQSCGVPPAGEHCEDANYGGGVSCTADGQGDWSCDCPRFEQCRAMYARQHPIPPPPGTPDAGPFPPAGHRNPSSCGEALYTYCECQ
jgi:hypothetical protein